MIFFLNNAQRKLVTKVIIEFPGGTVVTLFLLQTAAHVVTLSLAA